MILKAALIGRGNITAKGIKGVRPQNSTIDLDAEIDERRDKL